MNGRMLSERSQEGVTMAPTRPKTIIYRYNGDPNSDEEEFDQYGEFAVPKRNSIFLRHGRLWKTVRVKREIGSPGKIPIVRVFLMGQNI